MSSIMTKPKITCQLEIDGDFEEWVYHFDGLRITRQNFKILANALKDDTTLTDLIFPGLDDTGMKYLAEALECNKSLQMLILGYNNITDDGMDYLAKALEKNKAVKFLHLNENYIGDDGCQAIADMLKKNTTLQSIDLHRSRFGDKGAQKIAMALTQNRTINRLNISSVNFKLKEESLFYFFASLGQHKPRVFYLSIEINKMTEKFEERILQALRADNTLVIKVSLPDVQESDTINSTDKFHVQNVENYVNYTKNLPSNTENLSKIDTKTNQETSEIKSGIVENRKNNSFKH